MRRPQPLAVTTDETGMLVALTRGRRRYRVTGTPEHWRVADEWWGDEVRRDYFRVETDRGLVLDIYHDTIDDSWYLVSVL